MEIKQGNCVKVKAFGGKILALYVVAVKGKTVVLTNEQEYKTAVVTKQEPNIQIGFPLEDVIEVDTSKSFEVIG